MYVKPIEREKEVFLKHILLKSYPLSEMPYEKAIRYGVEVLSDAELLAVILRTGSKETNVVETARLFLQLGEHSLRNLYHCSTEEMMEISGIGKVKAIQLKVIGELSKRISKENRKNPVYMTSGQQVAAHYMEQFRHEQKEHLYLIFLDTKCRYLGEEEVSMGTVNASLVSPREIFIAALGKKAVSILLLHNHPSGDPKESKEDIMVTMRIKECGELLGIQLVDHVIIGDNCYISFKENGIL